MSMLQRIARHLWFREVRGLRDIPTGMLDRLTLQIKASEQMHTGEIRLCIETSLPTSYLRRNATARQRAVTLFGNLRVWDTEHNNGVLVYLLLAERAIEVVADRGISSRVDPVLWQSMVERLAAHMGQGDVETGLRQTLDELSDLLRTQFSTNTEGSHPNELPDRPVVLGP